MVSERLVNVLRSGSAFREWLLEVLEDRINDKNCNILVYKLSPASHTVCRYDFEGQNYGVVAKFYAEPIGWHKHYNPARAMDNEFKMLTKLEKILDTPKPIAVRKKFNCVLVTEHVQGRSLYNYFQTEDGLYDKLTAVAHLQRRLHDQTQSDYRRDSEFAKFHKVLDRLYLDRFARESLNQLLGKWWSSPLLDRSRGCLVHNDANPVNYLFNHQRLYALDFESCRTHAHPVHDLGIMAAELKNYFGWKKNNPEMAEPYKGHFNWHYSRNIDEFHGITRILPFFMSLGLLRIARLGLKPSHRAMIFREALACLKSEA